ncbi:MAG: phosphoribosylanthranilate isomerase [Bacteroidia bacterium]|nr:phosphoribosylanthranilate isomerase [Bacteroidia bacterium]
MTAVKFCGMKDEDTMSYALELGVQYLGFIIDYPKSPRSLTIDEFCKKSEWLRKNNKGNYKVVAVSVDMDIANMERIIKEGAANVVQLHGSEDLNLSRRLKGRIETWKAVTRPDKLSSEEYRTLAASADKVLLDSGNAAEKASGTSGAFDCYQLYAEMRKEGIPVILSGGIDVGNVQSYISAYQPEIIDVSRGIETSPGIKSRQKMKEFMETLNRIQEEYATINR